MKTMNTTQVADLLNIKESTLINQRKRTEDRLTKLGCIFTTEGRGKNTTYHFTHISKEAKQMKLAKTWEEKFGVKPERPYLAVSYLFFLTHEPLAAVMSDADVAFELCGSKELRANVRKARMDLVNAGILKPLGATEYAYTLVTEDGVEVSTKDYNATAWHYFYERLGYHADLIALYDLQSGIEGEAQDEDHPEVQSAAKSVAWRDMKEEWGVPKKVKRRELTDKKLF